jgi:tetratricopeptide (TPR) repeat protein
MCYAGLLTLVVFPWCYTLVPMETRFRYFLFLPFAGLFETVGLAYTAVFIVIFVHEGGHWFFGRIVGIRISDFVVGTGSSPLRFMWRGIQFSFGPWLRWGYVRQIPARENLRFDKQLVYLAGGVVAEIVFLTALFFLSPLPSSLDPAAHALVRLTFFVFVSGAIGLWASVWPRTVELEGRMTPNDALAIRQAWKNRGREDELWQQFEWSNQANALCDAGKYAEAASIVERVVQAAPRDLEQRSFLASLYAAAGNRDAALREHREVIQRTEPDSAERLHALDAAATFALQLGLRDELARLRPVIEQTMQNHVLPTVIGTLGSLLVELDETEAGVKLLNRCVAETEAGHDHAIANAYLAKAALRMGRPQRAAELLGFAKRGCGDHPLVKRMVNELEPQLPALLTPLQLQPEFGERGSA